MLIKANTKQKETSFLGKKKLVSGHSALFEARGTPHLNLVLRIHLLSLQVWQM